MHVYYINLAHRTDRRAFMEKQFTGLGLAATRVEALTPIDLSDRQRRATAGGGMEGALCCVLSHRRAIGDFVASTAAWALILEDDAVLSGSLPAFLTAFETTPPVAAVVRIEAATRFHLTISRGYSEIGRFRLHRYTGWDLGAAGYVISRQGAHMVLNTPEPRGLDMDELLFHDVNPLARRLRALQAVPALCIQAANVSQDGTHARSDLVNTRKRPSIWRTMFRAIRRDTVEAARKAWWRFALGGQRTKVPFDIG